MFPPRCNPLIVKIIFKVFGLSILSFIFLNICVIPQSYLHTMHHHFFFVFNDLRRAVVICFVNIGGILYLNIKFQ